MADGVQEKIIKRCREAILGGKPIIYIKTDSDALINNVVSTGSIVYISDEFGNFHKNTLPNIKKYTTIAFPKIWTYKIPHASEERYDFNTRIFETLEEYVNVHENENDSRYNALQYSAVILYSTEVHISPMLRTYTEFVDVDLPDEDEISKLLLDLFKGTENERPLKNKKNIDKLCTSFLGFSAEEITLAAKRIHAKSYNIESNAKEVEEIITDQKIQKLEGGILSLCKTDGKVGGMENYLKWLNNQYEPLTEYSAYKKLTGTTPPKGVLLCGIPGCGKSEAAKFTAQTLGKPLLRMDISSLMDKYQGGSEEKMREALDLAERMSPCILWIDELEKGFSGVGNNGDSSAATFKRMFGYFLSWMQENRKPVFIFATANDIGGLPKEFFRSGRFDALYAVYLPTATECADIFKTCLEKITKKDDKNKKIIYSFDPDCYDKDKLMEIINNDMFDREGKPKIAIGSDIFNVVTIALRRIVREHRDVKHISFEKWRNVLKAVIDECNFYGESEENLNSIAVSYCRLLRKGFKPTGNVLFEANDYKTESLKRLVSLKDEYDRLDPESAKADELKKEIEENEILRSVIPKEFRRNEYDVKVFELLKRKINEYAVLIEKIEQDRIIK